MALAFAFVASRAVVGQRARSTLDGVSYTVRVTSSRRAAGAATASPGEGYVGHGIFAANRGRLEIVEGAADPVFKSGDYVLFDTSDLIVVHPATRDFVAVPRDSTLPALDSLAALGVQVTLSDVKVTLDSISAGDTVAGFPTMHYRMTTGFNMTVDAAIMVQRVGTESVTDYWVALVPGLPNNPLLRANGIPGSEYLGSMFRELSRRIDSVSARMGSTVALRAKTVSRLMDGPGQTTTVEQTSEVSDIARQTVDESLLVLPPDYAQVAPPGLMRAPVPGAAAKWRTRPTARLQRQR
jgi:hypothetical protein